jgi:hypothetical protein
MEGGASAIVLQERILTEGHKDHSAAKPQAKLEEQRGLRLKGICENTFN